MSSALRGFRNGSEGGERKFEAASLEPNSCRLLALGVTLLLVFPDPPKIQKKNPMHSMPARAKVIGFVLRSGLAGGILA